MVISAAASLTLQKHHYLLHLNTKAQQNGSYSRQYHSEQKNEICSPGVNCFDQKFCQVQVVMVTHSCCFG